MKTYFVDTNYFIRLIENDVDKQVLEVKKLFEQAIKGEVKLYSSVIVLFEIYWLLKSFYEKRGKELQKILIKLLEMSYVDWQDREILIKAVNNLIMHRGDLEDAYNLQWLKARKIMMLASFDRNLKKYWQKIGDNDDRM